MCPSLKRKQSENTRMTKHHFPPQQAALGSQSHRSQVCLRSLAATSGTAGFLLQDNTQWFICPARSSGALIRTHRVILMLSLPAREPFRRPAGIHHFPALTPTSPHCSVWTHRRRAVCLTPTRPCCRRHRVTRLHPEVKSAFLFFFFFSFLLNIQYKFC